MENLSTRTRRKQTIKAATGISAIYGTKSDAPVLLKDFNSTVIHLAPSPVVAKVATSTLRKQHASNLGHELNVALNLANLGAPIVRPSTEIPPAVYRDGDLEVTFWQYCPGEVLRAEILRLAYVKVKAVAFFRMRRARRYISVTGKLTIPRPHNRGVALRSQSFPKQILQLNRATVYILI
jgi:hypothetical protein